jgi:hypothetical protein
MRSEHAVFWGGTITNHGGTGWHRDIHAFDMAPLEALQADSRVNGAPYIQVHVALADDPLFHVVRGSHARTNTAAERAVERSAGSVPLLPGAVCVDLHAGEVRRER